MSRYHRQDPKDGWHHITNHAVGNEDLFINDRDRYEFVRRMNEAAEKYNVHIIAFCLMGNHFHLVLHCPEGRLAKFMHYLESIYAREFNMRHGRRGALLEREYYNGLIKDDGQALATIRYVHRNALELGIDIGNYPWSSYLAFVAGDTTLLTANPHVLRNLLGGAEEHRRYVQTDVDTDEISMSMGVRQVYRSTPDRVDHTLMTLCELAAAKAAVTIQEIVAPRSTARNDARLAVTLIAYESRTGFADEIRSFLGYRTAPTLRSAVNRARKRAAKDPDFRRLVAALRSAWAAATDHLAS